MAPAFEPYARGSFANELYPMLFCDDLAAYRPKPGGGLADWRRLLFDPDQDAADVAELAEDPAAESRVRALAYSWLRGHGRETQKGVVLGIVMEVPLELGLDVLAAYADGSVRYINQTGKVTIIEPGSLAGAGEQARRLIDLARPVVAQIGPWDKARLPPPAKPKVRLSFVVSDGLYFGEGAFEVMQGNALAGPLLAQGARLLSHIVGAASGETGS